MTQRNPLVVLLLTFITFGIYGIYWQIVTANEMNARGAQIPHWILIFVPIANFYWVYKYCEGVEKVSGGQQSGVTLFVLWLFISIVAVYLAQDTFNKLANAPVGGPSPVGFGGPQQTPGFPSPAPANTPVAAAPFSAPAPDQPVVTPTTPDITPVASADPVPAPAPTATVVEPQQPVAAVSEPVAPAPAAPVEPQVFQPTTPPAPAEQQNPNQQV